MVLLTTICLIRHGETDWNVEKKIQGRSNIPLNEKGIHQVREVHENIWNTKWDVIYSSPLDRAVQTAQIIHKTSDIPLEIDDAFIEKSFGDVEGKPYDEVFSTYPDGIFPQAETYAEVVERVRAAFFEIERKHKGEHVLVVTHGAVIHALLAHLEAIPTGLEHIVLHHLCMNTFVYTNEQWKVESFNRLPTD